MSLEPWGRLLGRILTCLSNLSSLTVLTAINVTLIEFYHRYFAVKCSMRSNCNVFPVSCPELHMTSIPRTAIRLRHVHPSRLPKLRQGRCAIGYGLFNFLYNFIIYIFQIFLTKIDLIMYLYIRLSKRFLSVVILLKETSKKERC